MLSPPAAECATPTTVEFQSLCCLIQCISTGDPGLLFIKSPFLEWLPTQAIMLFNP